MHERVGMRSFFALMATALVAAAASSGATLWDGGYYFFQILDADAPFVAQGRLINVPLHWTVLLASRLTDDLQALAIIFGLTYATLPLLALGVSWWIVRDRAPASFVWAAFGIGLGTVLLQLYFVSEAIIAIQLFWPILLAMLIGAQHRHLPAVVALSAAVLLAHPVAIPLFALAAVLAGMLGVRVGPGRARRRAWLWGGAFATLAVVAAVQVVGARNSYEAEQLSLRAVRAAFADSMNGLTLVALACTWGAALLIFAAPFVDRLRDERFVLGVYAAELGALMVAGAVLFIWARDPRLWAGAIGFRTLALFASLPLMGLAALEGLLADPARAPVTGPTGRVWPHRLRTIQVIAVIFLIVLVSQGTSWLNLNNRLRETLTARPTACVAKSSLGWIEGTPLDNWTLTVRSLWLQGPAPRRVMLDGDWCAEGRFVEGLPVAPWERRPWHGGRFALAPLEERLSAEQQSPRGCRFLLSSHWYAREDLGAEWWRWGGGRGSLFVFSDRDIDAELRGRVESIQRPNDVEVMVNGEQRSVVRVTWSGMGTINPLPLRLKAGVNVIELVSRAPATRLPTDDRLLAVAISNLRLTMVDGALDCELQN